MRAIVFGAGGQLGVELVAELIRRGHETAAYHRKQLDITDPGAVERAIERQRPDWVINSAAYNLVDLAESEPEKAYKINALAVRTVALACEKAGATLLHYSTDHVFDGEKTEPYTEEDPPRPRSAYGISKYGGELYAGIGCSRLYLVRVAGVFGPAGRSTRRGNFPELVLRKAKEGSPLKVVDDFFATPAYAPALASRSIDLLEKAPPGTYHLGGGECLSWYEFARRILRAAGREDADVSPTNHREFHTPANRPRRSPLSNAKAEAAGIAPMPALDDCIREYLERRKQVRAPG